MPRLKPNMNVIKMTGFAIAFTYFGAFAFADSRGMTTEEVIHSYPIPFYIAMAIAVTLFLQGEIQDQKEALKEEEAQRKREEKVVQEATEKKKKPRTRKKKAKKK